MISPIPDQIQLAVGLDEALDESSQPIVEEALVRQLSHKPPTELDRASAAA
jgi:hypothetical protein